MSAAPRLCEGALQSNLTARQAIQCQMLPLRQLRLLMFLSLHAERWMSQGTNQDHPVNILLLLIQGYSGHCLRLMTNVQVSHLYVYRCVQDPMQLD